MTQQIIQDNVKSLSIETLIKWWGNWENFGNDNEERAEALGEKYIAYFGKPNQLTSCFTCGWEAYKYLNTLFSFDKVKAQIKGNLDTMNPSDIKQWKDFLLSGMLKIEDRWEFVGQEYLQRFSSRSAGFNNQAMGQIIYLIFKEQTESTLQNNKP